MNFTDPTNEFDLGIIGAGPAGAAVVWKLKNLGLRILWIDKDPFPRDKICGDAIPYETYAVLDRLEPGAADELRAWTGSEIIQKTRLYTPSGRGLEIRWKTTAVNSARFDFDHWLVQKALSNTDQPQLAFGSKVLSIERDPNHFVLETQAARYRCKQLIGAGGAHCPLARMANLERALISSVRRPERQHKLAAVRAYAHGIEGIETATNEVHALKRLLPGYFWMFPLPDGRVNLGLGMLATDLARRKLDLKKELLAIASEGPLAERFRSARVETVRGFELPLGSSRSIVSGDRFLLCGDAASLIDPIDGHGIGTALHSGECAAEAILELRAGRPAELVRREYEARLEALYYKKHRLHRRLLRLAGSGIAIDFLARAPLLKALGMDAREIA